MSASYCRHPLRTIVLSLFLMPFYGMTSLLALDRQARISSYMKLFDCSRKLPGADHIGILDTTIAELSPAAQIHQSE